ncbi:LPXTG cell wall anchor domain-containing protein [Asanoa sp. WMMD1127]|uniref:LPXTG cell wall anchor domain-containing protein n=1 Tax=Asanoa sp. WMMD1127 TaxID=3016107 RepID=UPI002415E1A3|nr:LPXTG cell wall anchor domain-containing protein [Asanoa sp. WMMD1127]MDG4821617.1 LPXTG cell wall anchor domain-containing protein [Asanoa sp. WMMD1127]
MKLRNRALLRAGVAAAAAVAASTAFAAPALADDTADLGIKLEGTTIAANAQGKFAAVSLSNAGPSDARGILVTIDVSKLDTTKVELVGGACGEPENGKILCGLVSDTITAGAEYDWDFPLVKKDGATGKAGTVTVTIEHDGTDENSKNNSATADVVVSEDSGADLRVWSPDVYGFDPETKGYTEEPVAPGGESRVYAEVLNLGDMTAKGLAFKVSLPQHVTFTEPEPECDFSADKRVATCDYTDFTLKPFAPEDEFNSRFYWAIKVDENAPAPATLHGSVTVAAIDEVEVENPPTVRSPKAADLPENFKDIDKTDNTDEFGVFVAEPGGSGGGLPVTGPAAGILGGVGGAVVIAGALLFFLARRRRIVTVTPDA